MNEPTDEANEFGASTAMRNGRDRWSPVAGDGRGRLLVAAACAGLMFVIAGGGVPALAAIDGVNATAATPSTASAACPALAGVQAAARGDVADLIALHRGVGSGAISAMPHELARRPALYDDARACAHRVRRADGRSS